VEEFFFTVFPLALYSTSFFSLSTPSPSLFGILTWARFPPKPRDGRAFFRQSGLFPSEVQSFFEMGESLVFSYCQPGPSLFFLLFCVVLPRNGLFFLTFPAPFFPYDSHFSRQPESIFPAGDCFASQMGEKPFSLMQGPSFPAGFSTTPPQRLSFECIAIFFSRTIFFFFPFFFSGFSCWVFLFCTHEDSPL